VQEGFTDLRTNPYRATIDKRDHGTVTFRFIAGNSDTRADGERIDLEFNPSLEYFWKSHGAAGSRGSSFSKVENKAASSTTVAIRMAAPIVLRRTSRMSARRQDAQGSIPRPFVARSSGTSGCRAAHVRQG
jgi:hypothetical protein